MAGLFPLLSLNLFQLVGLSLNIVCLLIVFLLGKVVLDLSQVEQLSGLLVCWRKLLLQGDAVVFKVLNVLFFQLLDFFLVIFLSTLNFIVPVEIKLLVLLDMSIFTLLSLLLMGKEHLLHRPLELLLLKFGNAVLGHFSL